MRRYKIPRKCANSPKLNTPRKCRAKKESSKKIRCQGDDFSSSSEEIEIKKRQKKNAHNLIEKRRRIQINDRINELATLLPKVSEPFGEVIDMHCSDKSGILKSTVEYIKCLKSEVEKLRAEAKQFQDLQKNNNDFGNRIKCDGIG
uniref:BHLH domain-containing protein n=1 Tax=Lutzomyia longipalpis TaxID=7200 RepID=A0A1B0CKS1_LUTLO